jgi:hypothetical protein
VRTYRAPQQYPTAPIFPLESCQCIFSDVARNHLRPRIVPDTFYEVVEQWHDPLLRELIVEVNLEYIRASRWLLNQGSKSSDVMVVFPFHLSWFDSGLSNDHHRVEHLDHGLTVTYSFGRGSPSNKSGTTTLNPSWAHSSATSWLWMYSGPKTLVNRIIVFISLFSSGLEGGLTTYVRRPCRSWNWPIGIRLFSWESCC